MKLNTQKLKKALKSIAKYLRELSVVVAGIAITFLVSDLISDRNEKKEIERYLEAIKIELKNNLKEVEEHGEYYTEVTKLSDYLLSTEHAKLSADSLEGYDEVVRRIVVLGYKTSALEMFKISGGMRLIKEKTLLNSILNSYSQIEFTQVSNEIYMNRKMDEIYEQVLAGNSFSLDLDKPENKRLLTFFSIYMDVDKVFKDCAKQIKETIELLESRK